MNGDVEIAMMMMLLFEANPFLQPGDLEPLIYMGNSPLNLNNTYPVF